jgi:prepilin-type N-terminal cleavage/methylation domain-containing protein
MVHLKKKEGGFTLLEVLIVLVILAVLAGLAVPAYTSAVEKSRKQEALSSLGAVRAAQQRYYSSYNTYAAAFASLDFDPTLAVTGNVVHYTYTLGGGAGNTYTATATRNAIDRPTGVPAYTVTIIQDGTVAANY